MALDFLKKNFNLKIISLILAVSLWLFVRSTESPLTEVYNKFILTDIQTLNVPAGTLVLDLPEQVELTVKGTPKTIKKLKPEDFQAYIDVKEKALGLIPLEIRVRYPVGVEISKIKPGRVLARLDTYGEKKFSLELKTEGGLPSGFTIGKPVFSPSEVDLKGPESVLSQVKKVYLLANISGVREDIVQRIQPVPVNDKSEFIEKLEINPKSVRVVIPVKSNLISLTLPVNPVIVDYLKVKYYIKEVRVEPPVATILVSQETNLGIKLDYLQTDPISIKQISKDLTRTVKIIIPAGVFSVSSKSVKVTIFIGRK